MRIRRVAQATSPRFQHGFVGGEVHRLGGDTFPKPSMSYKQRRALISRAAKETTCKATPNTAVSGARRPSRRSGAACVAVALIALGVLVTGCGGTSPSGGVASIGKHASKTSTTSSTAAGSTGSASPESQAVAYSACVRAHGVPNFPDPKITTHGNGVSVAIGINPSISSNPHFKSAQQACKKLLPGGGPGGEAEPSDQPPGTVAVPEGRRVHPLPWRAELPRPDVLRRRGAPCPSRAERELADVQGGGAGLRIVDPRRCARRLRLVVPTSAMTRPVLSFLSGWPVSIG